MTARCASASSAAPTPRRGCSAASRPAGRCCRSAPCPPATSSPASTSSSTSITRAGSSRSAAPSSRRWPAARPRSSPPHFAELFEDAAIYAQPAGGPRRSSAISTATAPRYEERSRRGVEFVENRFSHAAHARRLQELMRGQAPARRRRPPPGADCGAGCREPGRAPPAVANLAPRASTSSPIDLDGVVAGLARRGARYSRHDRQAALRDPDRRHAAQGHHLRHHRGAGRADRGGDGSDGNAGDLSCGACAPSGARIGPGRSASRSTTPASRAAMATYPGRARRSPRTSSTASSRRSIACSSTSTTTRRCRPSSPAPPSRAHRLHPRPGQRAARGRQVPLAQLRARLSPALRRRHHLPARLRRSHGRGGREDGAPRHRRCPRRPVPAHRG